MTRKVRSRQLAWPGLLDFAKVTICALLPFVAGAANDGSPPNLHRCHRRAGGGCHVRRGRVDVGIGDATAHIFFSHSSRQSG